jgi:predicted transposase YbfD/YdcC
MESLGLAVEKWFRKFLELPHGIPDSNTFQRLFARVSPDELDKGLKAWFRISSSGAGKEISIDGKTIRGSANSEENARHIVTAFVGENHLSLGQVKTAEKSNEITAIPELLDLIDIKGGIVTIDAMGTQKEIAKKIKKDKGADYILSLKGNHPETYNQVVDCFKWIEESHPKDEHINHYVSGTEKGHGRIEHREVIITSDIDWFFAKTEWEGLRSIVLYRRYCYDMKTKTNTVYDRYYITSLSTSAERMCTLIRNHWDVENKLHWTLDITFGEDGCKARKNNAPQNLNIMRKVALTLLKQLDSDKKLSLKRKMFKALMDDAYREKALKLGNKA